MSKGKELLKNTGILFIGKISTQFVSFLLLPLYTAKLTTEEYGILDLYITIGSILIPILSLQLEQAIFRYLLTSEDDEKKVLSSTTLFLLLSSLALTVVFIPVAHIISIQYGVQVLLYYITLLLCTVIQQVPRGYGDYTLYTLASFLSSTISIIFSVIFICVFDQGIGGILKARIISAIFIVLYIGWKSKVFGKIRFKYCSTICIKSMLKYSVPLVFNQLASWVVNSSDRVIVIAFLGIGTNGVYAIANKFFTLITTTLNIYNIAWTESVTKTIHDKERNAYYNKVFSLTTSLFLLAASGITSGIGILFKYFINESYNEAYVQIPILVYAAMFSGLSANVGSVYIAYKKTKEISYTTIATAVINVIVHLGLIKFIGLYAASLSTLVSFGIMFFYRIYKIRNTERLTFNFKALLSQVPFALVTIIAYYLRIMWLQIIGFLLLSVYAIYYIVTVETFHSQLNWILERVHKK